jgi:nitrogen-specific signal transduction histidine kinase
MAAVYGIVKNHGGWISVDSQLGKGTVVRIYFPVVQTAAKLSEKPNTEPDQGPDASLIN